MKKRTVKLGEVFQLKDGGVAVVVDGLGEGTIIASPVLMHKRPLKDCPVVTAPLDSIGLEKVSYINCGHYPVPISELSKKLGRLSSAMSDKVFAALYRSNTEAVFS